MMMKNNIDLFKKETGFDLQQVESCYQQSEKSKYKIICNTDKSLSLYEIFTKISDYEEAAGVSAELEMNYDDIYIIM